jgi:hypothetical protein
MTDQAIANLKKKLDALSQKAPAKEKKVEEHKIPIPVPKPENKLNSLTPEEIMDLKRQLGVLPQEASEEAEEVEEEEIEEEPVSEPTEEDLEQYKKVLAEIERMQNTGAFRVELLYQALGINSNLDRIATALEKLIEKLTK